MQVSPVDFYEVGQLDSQGAGARRHRNGARNVSQYAAGGPLVNSGSPQETRRRRGSRDHARPRSCPSQGWHDEADDGDGDDQRGRLATPGQQRSPVRSRVTFAALGWRRMMPAEP
jgi:hypothetical protein